MNGNLRIVLLALTAGVIAFGIQPSAHATPTLELISGFVNVTVAASSNPCAVTYVGTVGNFSVNITTGLEGGSTSLPTLSISSLDATNASTNGGTLTILFSDVGFGPTDGTVTDTATGTLALGARLTYSTYADSANVLFGTTSTTATLLASQAFPTNPLSGEATGSVVESDPYSLTQEIVLTEGGGETTRFYADLVTTGASVNQSEDPTAIPDGASTVALLGLTLVGIEGLRRKLVKGC